MRINQYGQPVGNELDWTPPPALGPVVLEGRTCRVEPLERRHADDLYTELCVSSPPETWTYLPVGPFDDAAAMGAHIDRLRTTPAMVPFAIVTDRGPAGIATYLRIEPPHGCAEVGFITMGRSLQRTTASTEALVLMAEHVFGAGYRRYEWKCDSLNSPSRRAALRLGFSFEGIFRQAQVVKGRNRDTAWYAMTDGDWPRISAAYDAWLDTGNFDDGRQRSALAAAQPVPDSGGTA